MRGKHALNITPQIQSYKEEVKGRNARLIRNRDRKLAARYYYYVRLHRLQYETTINCLSNEFDISPRRIVDILANSNFIGEYTQTAAGLTELRKEFPFLLWKEPAQLSLF